MTTTATQNHQIPTTPPGPAPRWTPRRVIPLALAAFLFLGAASSLGGAALLDGVDDERRDGDYLTSDETTLRADGNALSVEESDFDGLSGDRFLGDARVRATSSDPDESVFVGIARTDDVADYLRDVEHSTVTDVDDPEYVEHDGGAPATDPAELDIWVAQSSGPGTQSVEWTPEEGEWTAVIMNADGTAGVDVQADVGATVPVLEKVVDGLWITGAAFALVGAALVAVGLRRR
jgi:hypothetical protein